MLMTTIHHHNVINWISATIEALVFSRRKMKPTLWIVSYLLILLPSGRIVA
jgi:hypothetical protein